MGAVAEAAAAGAVRLEAVLARRAGAIAVGERRDDEITRRKVRDRRTDCLDDADELVADAADGVLVDAAVVPQVRAAHATPDDPHDRVSRLLDDRVGPLSYLDRPGSFEYRSSHR
jgi:hypothetical protein